jgi:hypothetical protein
MAEGFFIAGTALFILLGGAHVLGTLVDTARPTFFTPNDERVLPAMDGTGLRLRAMFPGTKRDRPSMWRAWLGFNLSHGMGALLFGVLLLAIAVHDFDLVRDIGIVRPLSIAASATYLVLALRFWFYAPAVGVGLATGCFVVAALA